MNDGGYGKMKAYKDLSKEELRALQTKLQAEYEELKKADMKLDMSRLALARQAGSRPA